jgi:hypothetical protein
MDAFLTLNATWMSFYKLATFDGANSPEALMVKSLRGLRLSLPDLSIAGGGERIILDIFFLAFSEFYRQNYDVMRMHLKMIRRLVPLLGGFSSRCQYVREACCYTELCFAIETGQRPVFDLTWDPGLLHDLSWQRLKATLHSSKEKVLSTGFADALSDGFFDTSMTTIIEELLVDLQAFEFIHQRKGSSPLRHRMGLYTEPCLSPTSSPHCHAPMSIPLCSSAEHTASPPPSSSSSVPSALMSQQYVRGS